MSSSRHHFTVLILVSLFLLGAGIPLRAQTGGEPVHYYYIGAVGNRPVQMDLSITRTTISGTFYFVDDGIRHSADGKLGKGGRVQMRLLRIDTNHLLGRIQGHTGRDLNEINGTWTGVTGGSDQDFHLIKVAEYLDSNIRQGQLISMQARYPFFLLRNEAGQYINRRIQDSVLQRQTHFLKEGQRVCLEPVVPAGWQQQLTYGISYFSPELISLSGSVYLYTGGAHGMHNPQAANFVIRKGHVYQLTLDDLFRPGTAYRDVLSRECIRLLYTKGASWVRNGDVARLAGPDMQHFSISPKGLTFYFPPYLVGPYSDGSFQITIPFDSLRTMLDENGPLQDLLTIVQASH